MSERADKKEPDCEDVAGQEDTLAPASVFVRYTVAINIRIIVNCARNVGCQIQKMRRAI